MPPYTTDARRETKKGRSGRDELPDHDHEMRAFFESLAISRRSVTPLAVADGGLHWLLRYE